MCSQPGFSHSLKMIGQLCWLNVVDVVIINSTAADWIIQYSLCLWLECRQQFVNYYGKNINDWLSKTL